jgi:hypothetical protein
MLSQKKALNHVPFVLKSPRTLPGYETEGIR